MDLGKKSNAELFRHSLTDSDVSVFFETADVRVFDKICKRTADLYKKILECRIENEAELRMLRSLLCFKLKFIGENSCKLHECQLQKIIIKSFQQFPGFLKVLRIDFSIVCSIIRYSLSLLDDEDILSSLSLIISGCKSALEYLSDGRDSKFEISDIDLFTVVRILELVFDSASHLCSERCTVKDSNQMKHIFSDTRLYYLLAKCMFNEEKVDITTCVAITIIPKAVEWCESGVAVSEIWKSVLQFFSSKSNEALIKILPVICILADYYIPNADKERNVSLNLLNDLIFWDIIQNGLIHNDFLFRKQAIYLLRRCVDAIPQLAMDPSFVTDTQTAIFQFNVTCLKESKNLWDNYILVIETLEEKQIHLVKPVLPYVEKLIEKSSCAEIFLHESWISCLFHRILQHSNISIVKWGIVNLIDKVNVFKIYNDNRNIMQTMLTSLNNTSLYNENELNKSSVHLHKSLINLFASAETMSLENAIYFYLKVFNVMKSLSWAPVPLFYVSYALAHNLNRKLWTAEVVNSFCEFINNAIICQDVYIRGAVQCLLLQTVINQTNIENLSIEIVTNVLSCFRNNECLKRNTICWRKTMEWLNCFIEPGKVDVYLGTNLLCIMNEGSHVTAEINSLIKLMIICFDAQIICFPPNPDTCQSFFTYKFINKLKATFFNTSSRTYASCDAKSKMLTILLAILKESRPHINISNDTLYTWFYSLVLSLVNDIFDGLNHPVSNHNSMNDFILYIELIELLSDDVDIFDGISSNLLSHLHKLELKLYDLIADILKTHSVSLVRKYICMRLLSVLASTYKKLRNSKEKLEKFIARVSSEVEKLEKMEVSKCADCDVKNLSYSESELLSSCLHHTWLIIDMCYHYGADIEKTSLSMLYKAIEYLDIGSSHTVISVLKTLQLILSLGITEENILHVKKSLNPEWIFVSKVGKNDLFWPAFHAHVEMCFQKSVMNSDLTKELLLQIGQDIIVRGDQVTGLVNVLMEQLRTIVTASGNITILYPFVELLAEGITFGPVHRKDRKIINTTYRCIEDLGENVSVNMLLCHANTRYADNDVRACALDIILKIVKHTDDHYVTTKLIEILLEKDRIISRKATRYFADSYIHRFKHRILQVLLVLEPVITQEKCRVLAIWLCDSLLNENHQHSVRYQQEWLLIRILYHHEHLRGYFWNIFTQASEKRMGSMCSFIAIVYHLCHIINGEKEDRQVFIDNCMEKILPWCMGQHFSVRLFAQVSIQKLYNFAKEEGFHCVTERFSVIYNSLRVILEEEKSIKNIDQLQDDFYFCVFHPLQHYTLETIYYLLPKLANMTSEEWIPVSRLSKFITNETFIPILNKDSDLRNHKVASWVLKAKGKENEESAVISAQFSETVQKKIIPWRDVVANREHNILLKGQREETDDKGLVVVASLIDRTPNLGGLSRTCEVFGVSEYVISSLRYTEDKQFQVLSKTAEKWISITEVKPNALPLYLKEMKNEGYTVVGAEQTANNTNLQEVKLPKKTLLLLGNETEGIPANLLPLLDICVEIPQQGVIRSLNVHVTGAIFIWEYYRQHSLT